MTIRKMDTLEAKHFWKELERHVKMFEKYAPKWLVNEKLSYQNED